MRDGKRGDYGAGDQRSPAAQRWAGYQRWNWRVGGTRASVESDCDPPEDRELIEVTRRVMPCPELGAFEPMA